MSDYTPTTEEVRKIYADYRDDIRKGDPSESYPLSGHEFDRWLAEIKADAWAEGAIAVHKYFDSLDRVFSTSNIPRNPYEKKTNA